MNRLRQKEKVRKRRHKRILICKRIKRYIKNEWLEYDKKFIEREIQMFDTRPRCSCFMCGNPRKHSKSITLKEQKFFDEMKDWEHNNGL